MTLVMAESNQPVFRDFLGIGHMDNNNNNNKVKQLEFAASEMRSTTRSSFELDSEGDEGTIDTRMSWGTSSCFKNGSGSRLVAPSFSLALSTSSDPGSVALQQTQTGAVQHQHRTSSAFYKLEVENSQQKVEKRWRSPTTMESLQPRLVEVTDSPRLPKVARHEYTRHDKMKVDAAEQRVPSTNNDGLHLSMQPPRTANKCPAWLSQSSKNETSETHSRILELARPPFQSGNNMGIILTRGLSHLGACAERLEKAERAPSNLYCDNITSINSQVAQPAADEGSRTGLKGSLLTGLLHDPGNTATPAGSSDDSPFSVRPPKMGSRNAGTESMPLPGHEVVPACRPLTIFYGGQTHVYDDISPDKADKILELAGLNGRSWSTSYSRRSTSKPTNSLSHHSSLSAAEREKEKVQKLMWGLSQNQNGIGTSMGSRHT